MKQKRWQQRLLGLGLTVLGALSALPEGDATAAVVLVPLGLWILCSRKNLLY